MPLFGACPHCEDYRQQRDRAQAELSTVLSEQSALVKEALAMKRHDLGMPPAGFTVTDPLEKLGKRTKAAINEMSLGSASLNSHLTNWALTEWANAEAQGERNQDEVDQMIAHAIKEGEAG